MNKDTRLELCLCQPSGGIKMTNEKTSQIKNLLPGHRHDHHHQHHQHYHHHQYHHHTHQYHHTIITSHALSEDLFQTLHQGSST
jgi:hypothetical protein